MEAALDDPEEIRPGVIFFELAQHRIIERFGGRNDEETARLAKSGQEICALQEMLDLNGHVVGELRELTVQGLDERNGVPDSVEKVWIAEGDVLRIGGNLLANVRQNDVAVDNAENPVVYRNDRAVTAEMLAPAARFRVAHSAMFARGQNEMGVGTKRRKIRTVGNLKAQACQRDLRIERVNLRKSGKVGKVFGEVDESLFEFAAQQTGDTVRAKAFRAQRGIESVGAVVCVRVHATKRLNEFHREARGGVHGYVKGDEASFAQSWLVQGLARQVEASN